VPGTEFDVTDISMSRDFISLDIEIFSQT